LRRKFAAPFRDKRKPTPQPSPLSQPRSKRRKPLLEPPASGPPRLLRLRPPRRLLQLRHPRLQSRRHPPHRSLLYRTRRSRPLCLLLLRHRHLPPFPSLRNRLRRPLLQRQRLNLQRLLLRLGPPLRQRHSLNLQVQELFPLRTASHFGQLHQVAPAVRLLSVLPFLVNSDPVGRPRNGRLRLLHQRAPAPSRNVHCLPATAVRCRLATVDQCPLVIAARFLLVTGPAARVPANPCVRNRAHPGGKAALMLRVLLAAPAVRKTVLILSDPEVFLLAHAPVRASPVAPACFRRLRPTKCRPAPSPASHSTRAAQRSASAQVPTNAKWKESASFTLRASALVQGIAAH